MSEQGTSLADTSPKTTASPDGGAPPAAETTDDRTATSATPSATPPEVQRVLAQLPPEQRHVLEQSFSMMVQGPVPHPLVSKIEKEHLTKLLDGVENDNRRMYEDQRDERKHQTGRAVLGTLALVAVCVLFLWYREVPLLKDILGYLVAAAGGYGIGKGSKASSA